jgi:pyruvate ferredoxin oxidoreductase delta subunit/phenylglyoxylate dehydrogenase delta subunit
VNVVSELPEMHTNKSRNTRALLGPVATEFATVHTGSWRTERPEVDSSRCTKCGVCVQYCPTGVMEVHKEEEQGLSIEWYNCKGCGICANVCPRQCIRMIPERDEDGD